MTWILILKDWVFENYECSDDYRYRDHYRRRDYWDEDEPDDFERSTECDCWMNEIESGDAQGPVDPNNTYGRQGSCVVTSSAFEFAINAAARTGRPRDAVLIYTPLVNSDPIVSGSLTQAPLLVHHSNLFPGPSC